MKLRPSVASVISEHVVFELESIDRVYLNVYVPRLQREGGVAAFFRFHRGHLFASSALMDPISKEFVARLDRFARQQRVPVVQFRKGERKDDVAAGYRYQISILQAEFSLTQVLDRPAAGRLFFEEIIRENLDIGRPSQVQLIFGRRVNTRTPGRFRTRVITEGVIPSLHVDYKSSRIKQYFKLNCALRTETTINNTRDFGIGKRLKNLPALREVGFQANRRLLDVQTIAHDCFIGQQAYEQVVHPIECDGRRASALRFDDRRVQALFSALVMFSPHLDRKSTRLNSSHRNLSRMPSSA